MDAALEVPAGGDSFAEFPTYEDFLNSQVLYISVHFKIMMPRGMRVEVGSGP